jgi:hypothetical protein
MKHLTIFLICGFIGKYSFCQSIHSGFFFGKYEGIEIRYIKHVSDTSNRVDRMNETWGKSFQARQIIKPDGMHLLLSNRINLQF